MRDRILRTLHAGAQWEVGFSGRSAPSRDPVLTTLRADRILRTLRMEAPCGNRWRTRNAPQHVPKRTWARAETHPARTRAADPKRTLPGPKWRARNAPAPLNLSSSIKGGLDYGGGFNVRGWGDVRGVYSMPQSHILSI